MLINIIVTITIIKEKQQQDKQALIKKTRNKTNCEKQKEKNERKLLPAFIA